MGGRRSWAMDASNPEGYGRRGTINNLIQGFIYYIFTSYISVWDTVIYRRAERNITPCFVLCLNQRFACLVCRLQPSPLSRSKMFPTAFFQGNKTIQTQQQYVCIVSANIFCKTICDISLIFYLYEDWSTTKLVLKSQPKIYV